MTMRERPILFSAPMVRAILAGAKSQTRRIVKGPRVADGHFMVDPHRIEAIHWAADEAARTPLRRYAETGDRLWVRETHAQFAVGNRAGTAPQCVAYRATCDEDGGFDYVNNGDEIMRIKVTKWTPSIFMPRWASRITLEVTGVRVERLHDISEDDARAEGIGCTHVGEWTYEGESVKGRPWAHSFFILWNEINGRESWDANPWVWVVEFRRLAR